jgi:methylated-DNA-[protein]-cysteine S-methyltransferase
MGMLSVGDFHIAGRDIKVAVLWNEQGILGITYSLDGDEFLRERVSALVSFLSRRGVTFNTSIAASNFPETVFDVIKGELSNVDVLPMLSFDGPTSFERRVYEVLTKTVKRGEVITYGELARRLNTSPRAVGGAMMRNPYPIVVPCHRVVASNGIGNYTPKVSYKKFLLEIEGVKRWTNSKRTS